MGELVFSGAATETPKVIS